MNIDFSSKQTQDKLITLGVVVGFVLIFALVAGGIAFLTRGPDCADFWTLPDPNLMAVIYVIDLDERGFVNRDDPIRRHGWLSDNGDLKFYVESGGLLVSSELCFHEEGIDFLKTDAVPVTP